LGYPAFGPRKPFTHTTPKTPSLPKTRNTSFPRDGGPLGYPAFGPRKPFTHTTPKTPSPPTQARCEPVPSRRTLAAGIHALRSLDAGSLSASCLRSPATPARLARAHPSRTRIPCVLELEKGTGTSLRSEPVPFSIKAPRREPVGRRAVGRETPPQARRTVHPHHARNALTTHHLRHFTCRSTGRWAIPVPGSPHAPPASLEARPHGLPVNLQRPRVGHGRGGR